MKKLTCLFLFIFCLIVSGCSQTVTTSSTSKNGEDHPESDFPKKTIQLIVPTPPGGSNDTVARALANVVPKYLRNKQKEYLAKRIC